MDHDSWTDQIMQLIGVHSGDSVDHFIEQLSNSGVDLSGLTYDDIIQIFREFRLGGLKFGDAASDAQYQIDWQLYYAKRAAEQIADGTGSS